MKIKKTIFTNTFFVAICALLCTALWGSATPFIKTGYLCLNVEEPCIKGYNIQLYDTGVWGYSF